MTAAKERRLQIIDETNRQLSGRGGYGRGYREERVYREDRRYGPPAGFGRGYYD